MACCGGPEKLSVAASELLRSSSMTSTGPLSLSKSASVRMALESAVDDDDVETIAEPAAAAAAAADEGTATDVDTGCASSSCPACDCWLCCSACLCCSRFS